MSKNSLALSVTRLLVFLTTETCWLTVAMLWAWSMPPTGEEDVFRDDLYVVVGLTSKF